MIVGEIPIGTIMQDQRADRALAQPEQVLRGEQAVEMSVALLECAHCRFGRGLITEPYPAIPPSTVMTVPVI